MKTPYQDVSIEGLTSSIKVIARAQGLDLDTTQALGSLIKFMNSPKDPISIDEAIESAMMFHPTAVRESLFAAYEALYLYQAAKKNLSQAVEDGDTKAILTLLENFGKIEGYRAEKDVPEQKEVSVTITKQW